jgi:molybdate transport system substrate-binding protein
MKRLSLATAPLLLLAASCGRSRVDPSELTVFAAASLEDVAREVSTLFERETGLRVVLNTAGSNLLARQIEASLQGDVFLSASEEWIDWLEQRDRVEPGTRATILTNRLVVAAREDSTLVLGEIEDLASAPYRNLVLADPEAVPAGIYARTLLSGVALATGTLWERVADRVVPTLDVRAALALLEADPLLIGIVYATDAAISARIRVLLDVDASHQPPVTYGACLVRGTPQKEAALRYLAFLSGEEARGVFRRHGFGIPAE